MQVLKNRAVTWLYFDRNSNNDTGCIVLDELQEVNKRVVATIKKRIIVTNTGGNKCVNKILTVFRGEVATDRGYISEVVH